LAATGS